MKAENIFLVLYGFFLFSTATAQIPPAVITNGINQIFQGHVNQSLGLVPGHVVRIEKPGSWVYSNAAGVASIGTGDSCLPDMKFKIASITKLITSVAIFKLIQNGQLNLDSPIGKYLPLSMVERFDNYENITIRKLLAHTSGIDEPQSDFQGRLNYWIYMKRFEDIPLDSLLFWSSLSSRGVGNYYYSNANFYLLAEIIKFTSGSSYRDYVTNQFITPLGLTNTDFNTTPTNSFMRGYLRGSFYAIGSVLNGGLQPDSLYDFTEASNSWGYGAADIWSTTTDLIKFHKALFNGQLIANNWLDTMKLLVSNTGDMGAYGHGMILFKSFNGGPIYGFGHTGSAFGYGSMLCYIPSLDVYMCSAGNYMKIGQEFFQRDLYNFLNNNITTGVLNADVQDYFDVFPNPTTGRLNITTPFLEYQIEVMDLTGRLILSASNPTLLDLSQIKKGMYLLRLTSLGRISTKKIVME